MSWSTSSIASTILVSILSVVSSDAADVVAASCNTGDVQTAVDLAVDGDRVLIPDGSCSWTTGINTSKQIEIRAQNYTPTAGGTTSRSVTLTNNSTTVPLIQMASGNTYHVRLSGLHFAEGSGDRNHFRFTGSGTKPPLVADCYIEIKNRFGNQPTNGAISWLSLGGVMWNTYILGVGGGLGGQCCPEGGSFFVTSPRSWETASTMGDLDTGGNVNVYIEDSTWKDFGQSPDVDNRGRVVIRYSTMDGTSGLTHGFTSTDGGRHVEYYNNTFSVTSNNRNIAGRYFWLRAGTMVLHSNVVNNTSFPGAYGNVDLLDIGDNTAPMPPYPQERQPGFGHDGVAHVSDPIYIWNNTGSRAYEWSISGGWEVLVVEGRDIFVNAGAKPGYTPYTYPHPFRSESPVTGRRPTTMILLGLN